MLLDRGLVVEEGSSYGLVGEVESLEVPETLQALMAARLDGLASKERRLLQDAAVLGKTFTRAALAALGGTEDAEIEPLLTGLVRKELLGVQADPRSPEHGQYGFLQDLIRQVAYETLAKRDRQVRHLAAADHLLSSVSEDEVVEVVASHLVEAHRLEPDAADAEGLRVRAHDALLKAADRAASLGAPAEARRYFEQAGDLTDVPLDRAAALAQAGQMSLREASFERAASLFEESIRLYDQVGDSRAAARTMGLLALAEYRSGRIEQALERAERAYQTIKDDEPNADQADLLGRLGAGYTFSGDERAAEYTERALDLAEALQLPQTLVRGWNTKAILATPKRPEEARALYQAALATALEHDLASEASTACGNLSDLAFHRDRYAESLGYLERTLELARRNGDRQNEWFAFAEMTYALTMLGRYDEAFARLAELPDERIGTGSLWAPLTGVLEIHLQRGRLEQARELLHRHDHLASSSDLHARSGYHAASAAVRLAEGDLRSALGQGERAFAGRAVVGIGGQDVKQGFLHGLEAALALGELDKADELIQVVEQTPVGLRPPYLAALARRFRARLAGEEPQADRHFAAAVAGLRKLELPFHAGVAALEYGEWLNARGRAAEAAPLLAEACDTFQQLETTPWRERAEQASQLAREPSVASAI